MRGTKNEKGREGSKMEEGEWGGETGRRLWINSWKRGGREYQGGLKSDLAQQYNWGVQPGMTERSIAPKDPTPAARPAHPRAFG